VLMLRAFFRKFYHYYVTDITNHSDGDVEYLKKLTVINHRRNSNHDKTCK